MEGGTTGGEKLEWPTRAWLAFFFVMAVLLGLRFHGFAFDDAFISYRVAANIADGHGWVYNVGERVNAVTNPLYTLTLALLHLATGIELPLLGAFVSMAGLFCGAAFFALLLNDDESRPAGFLAAALVLCHPLLISCMGMETGMLIGLCGGALLAYKREQWALGGALFGLALLTRMDSVILAGVVLLHYVLTHRKAPPWRAPAAFLLVIAPWFIFSLLYFGELLPHTLHVKSAQTHSGGHWGGEWMFAKVLGAALYKFFGRFDITWIVVTACTATGLVTAVRMKSPWARLILAWAVLHAVAYALVLRVPPYTWYLAPVAIGIIALLGLGAARLIALAAEKRLVRDAFIITAALGILIWTVTGVTGMAPSVGKRFSLMHAFHTMDYFAIVLCYRILRTDGLKQRPAAMTAVAIMLCVAAFIPRHWNAYLQMTHLPTSQYSYYKATADWINQNRPAVETVGASEIGVLGYYLPDKKIIDQCGIPTPGAAERLAKGDMTWWITEHQPGLLVLHPARDWWRRIEGPVLGAKWFEESYRLAALFTGRDDSGGVRFYEGPDAVEALENSGILQGRAFTEEDDNLREWIFEKHSVMLWELVNPGALPESGRPPF
jgi:hypothetical protein